MNGGMITLRSYANPIEAGMAKSMLETNDIPCTLADENANAYGGAPLAMPVRLLVSEDQVDEARRILENAEKAASSDVVEKEVSMEETTAGILDELRKLRRKVETNTALFPTRDNEERLPAVRKRLEIEHSR